MHPRCCLYTGSLEAEELRFQATGIQATSWVHCTTSCNTQSNASEDGRDQRPKHVELIGTNKPLLLHLVGVYVVYINDARSLNSVALVRERTIPTERPPPVGEVSANFCG